MNKAENIKQLRDLFHEYVNKTSNAIVYAAEGDISAGAQISKELPELVTQIYTKINEIERGI